MTVVNASGRVPVAADVALAHDQDDDAGEQNDSEDRAEDDRQPREVCI